MYIIWYWHGTNIMHINIWKLKFTHGSIDHAPLYWPTCCLHVFCSMRMNKPSPDTQCCMGFTCSFWCCVYQRTALLKPVYLFVHGRVPDTIALNGNTAENMAGTWQGLWQGTWQGINQVNAKFSACVRQLNKTKKVARSEHACARTGVIKHIGQHTTYSHH